MNWKRKLKNDWGLLGLKYKPLSDIANYVIDRIEVDKLTLDNYISTENMISNKGGVGKSAKLPRSKTTASYKKGDVLISNIRPYFKKIWFSKNDGGCSNDILVLRAKEGIHPEYLYYVLSNDSFFEYATATSKGTKMPRGDKQAIMKYRVPDISLDIQIKIADMLSTIDALIYENNKINENLEEQANEIFINEFLALKTLPNGWTTANLTDIAEYLNGIAMQKYRPSNNEIGIPVLKIKELRQGFCDNNSDTCSPTIKHEYIIHDGDVIFSWSGSLLVDFWCGGICGLNQHLFKVTSNKYDKWFYYSWTKHHLSRFISIATDKATTMGHIKRSELKNSEVLIPNKSDYYRIGSLLQPIYDLIIANRIENKQLSEIRDLLLPKLITGEIDLSKV